MVSESAANASEQAAGNSDVGDGAGDEAKDTGRKGLSGKTKRNLLIAAILIAIGGGLWFMRYETYGQYFQETNDAQIDVDMVAIAPKVSGYVSEVLVEDNQDVAKDAPLVRIDASDYDARAAQARAQIAQAEASVENARAGIAEQQAAVAQARAQLAAARAKARHDAGEVARYAPLVASGAERRETLDQLKLAATQSAEQVRQLEAALTAQQRRIATLETQVAQARAQGEGAQAQLDAADVDLKATLIRAPIAGRIGDRTVRTGQFVQAGTRLMSVVPLDKLYVTANFKETQLALMRPGQPARISVDALEGTEINGRVASVSPGTGAQFSLLPPENATGNFTKIVQRVPVRIAIEAPASARKLLVPGLSVTVTVDTRSAEGELDQIEEASDEQVARRAQPKARGTR
ncbi:HlyD family secretion protein [Novosphingobium decolorationis]|uniref:HlyD family secretion protein n=1 Tax=Novosphingobium decolorationis TaxID=2698673 RepID=A0ABX8E5G6_9SPHN|nr:HlyD family secretion protein [Novosphingobium decolorationis]MED5544113.1 HlyD family secretion protein [Pseudomonadota bacterium]QVM83465.1 HlyD family secretion protein [Novosphingobium decolorationis]